MNHQKNVSYKWEEPSYKQDVYPSQVGGANRPPNLTEHTLVQGLENNLEVTFHLLQKDCRHGVGATLQKKVLSLEMM